MRVPQLPGRLLWDHNAHYHRWLLRQLPARGGRVLDVGCGSGAFARLLAGRAEHVDAVDVSPDMISRARAATSGTVRVRWLVGDVLEDDLPLLPGGYDAVTLVSSLHHMPLRPALARMAELVRPGGTLAVIGMYRPVSVTDHAVEALAVPANAAVGTVLAARGRAGKPHDDGMPVQQPTTTLREIRATTTELLPGARLRRCLFSRYSLLWHRPA